MALLCDQVKSPFRVTECKPMLERGGEALHHRFAEVWLGGSHDRALADQQRSSLLVVSESIPGDLFFGPRRRRRRVDRFARWVRKRRH